VWVRVTEATGAGAAVSESSYLILSAVYTLVPDNHVVWAGGGLGGYRSSIRP
jgi:hypothetical protein